MSEMVNDWRVEDGVGLVVNGTPFPYYVLAEGPMVESLDDLSDMHILWLPLLANGPVPRVGRPDGELHMPEADAVDGAA